MARGGNDSPRTIAREMKSAESAVFTGELKLEPLYLL